MGKKTFITKTDKMFRHIEREKIWIKQNKRCFHCKTFLLRSEMTEDHVIPLSKIGRMHSFKNCVISCERCNKLRGNNEHWKFKHKISETELFLSQGLSKLEDRIRLAEYRLSFNTKGSFSKWKKYWEKRGRW